MIDISASVIPEKTDHAWESMAELEKENMDVGLFTFRYTHEASNSVSKCDIDSEAMDKGGTEVLARLRASSVSGTVALWEVSIVDMDRLLR